MDTRRKLKLQTRIATSPLERRYRDLFKVPETGSEVDESSLEQPTPYKVVETITTYGPYQEPLR